MNTGRFSTAFEYALIISPQYSIGLLISELHLFQYSCPFIIYCHIFVSNAIRCHLYIILRIIKNIIITIINTIVALAIYVLSKEGSILVSQVWS